MSKNQIIGQKVAIKFTVIGLLILLLTLIIIGLLYFYVFDWPLNIGGKQSKAWLLIAVPFIVIGIGWVLSKYMGRWAGKMILDEGKSPFRITFLTLATIFTCMLLPFLNLPLLIFGIVISMVTARFMGTEIEREGQ